MGRVGKPEELAAAAVLLASDAASYVTGQYLSVCGGLITPVSPQYQDEYLSQFRGK
jgi:NAD(P)-dependent dehydrogenase (short-subunit alcohol dehydrogenase family)